MQIHFVIKRKIEDSRAAHQEGLKGGGHIQEAGLVGGKICVYVCGCDYVCADSGVQEQEVSELVYIIEPTQPQSNPHPTNSTS